MSDDSKVIVFPEHPHGPAAIHLDDGWRLACSECGKGEIRLERLQAATDRIAYLEDALINGADVMLVPDNDAALILQLAKIGLKHQLAGARTSEEDL